MSYLCFRLDKTGCRASNAVRSGRPYSSNIYHCVLMESPSLSDLIATIRNLFSLGHLDRLFLSELSNELKTEILTFLAFANQFFTYLWTKLVDLVNSLISSLLGYG